MLLRGSTLSVKHCSTNLENFYFFHAVAVEKELINSMKSRNGEKGEPLLPVVQPERHPLASGGRARPCQAVITDVRCLEAALLDAVQNRKFVAEA